MAFIVQTMIAIEQVYGNKHKLDFYVLLQCAINHDIAESVTGDIAYTDKNSDDEEEELMVYEDLIKEVFPSLICPYFPPPLDLNPNAGINERRFWEAAEHIGYCLFALEENATFDHVVEKSMPIIYNVRDFPSVRWFYDAIKEKML